MIDEDTKRALLLVADKLKKQDRCAACAIEAQQCDGKMQCRWAGREIARIVNAASASAEDC